VLPRSVTHRILDFGAALGDNTPYVFVQKSNMNPISIMYKCTII
jgi:hypothetical protein